MQPPARRLAIVASHPVQYVVPLYQRLASRADLQLKVFYTWHAGGEPVIDRGFRKRFAWDIPLATGYDFELVRNRATNPGPYGFFGLHNPELISRVIAWKPDVAIVNGWAWRSHLEALHALPRRGVRTLLRGDSHLLDPSPTWPRPPVKRAVLRRVFRWPAGFLAVGSANRAYYERFGVDPGRLFPCPHAVDVHRFAEPDDELRRQAAAWRRQLGIAPEQPVLLYAGKFEPKKRPLQLMRLVQRMDRRDLVLVLVGGGELQSAIDLLAAGDPRRFRVLPFQNQTRMPVVYRLGDIFVLPSGSGETWGLAVNEAISCGRPVVVSDRVGCAADVVEPSCGRVFPRDDWPRLAAAIEELAADPEKRARMGRAAAERARLFDIPAAEAALVGAVERVSAMAGNRP